MQINTVIFQFAANLACFAMVMESDHRFRLSGSKISKVWCRNCRVVNLQPKNAFDLWVELRLRRKSRAPIQGHFENLPGL